MPFDSHFLNVSVLPHVLSKVDYETKINCKTGWRNFKLALTKGTFTTITIKDGIQLSKDIMSSKLKAYGYKSLLGFAVGPLLQILAVPLYISTFGLKTRRIALMVRDLGAYITRSEAAIMNWAFLLPDIVLFGEPVPILENDTFVLIHNETLGSLTETLDKIGDENA